jgi:hypothetical protein
MEAGAMTLEKALVLTGEVIESNSIWQGAPASKVFSYQGAAVFPSTTSYSSISSSNDVGSVI